MITLLVEHSRFPVGFYNLYISGAADPVLKWYGGRNYWFLIGAATPDIYIQNFGDYLSVIVSVFDLHH